MIHRFILPMVLLALPASTSPFADCEKGCKTTVIVQDCEGAPVANAKVQIKVCCNGGSETETSTNQNGEAEFSYCIKDICGSRIVLQGFGVSSFDPNGCEQGGKTSRCTIKVCHR